MDKMKDVHMFFFASLKHSFELQKIAITTIDLSFNQDKLIELADIGFKETQKENPDSAFIEKIYCDLEEELKLFREHQNNQQ